MSVSNVPVSDMALALLTSMSIPPNALTAASTAAITCFSSRTSTTQGRHFPPAASTDRKHANEATYQIHKFIV